MRHGSGLIAGSGDVGGPASTGLGLDPPGPVRPSPAGRARRPDPSPYGLRHFIRTPHDDERCRLARLPPDRVRELMSRLSLRMEAPLPWGRGPEGDNPDVPAGYTYIMQLVGHDLVETAVPISLVPGHRDGLRNERLARLKLDTIYGGGPLVRPHAYAADGARPDARSRLRLGRMKATAQHPACPFRDLARIAVADPDGGDADAPTEPLIADARNDDHALISQLAVLFHLLHNGVVGLVSRAGEGQRHGSALEASHRVYLCARHAVTLVYRSVIRGDVMRRLLHPAVYRSYATGRASFIDPLPRAAPGTGDWRLPLEYSQGVFRFGHAMVRDFYRINDRSLHRLPSILSHNSLHGPATMPLDHTWIVQWSQFFTIDGSTPNLSRRIGPGLSPGFLSDHVFGSLDRTRAIGLGYRDLIGAAFGGLWSVAGLAEQIRRARPDLARQSRLLSDPAFRADALRRWLGEHRDLSGLTETDVALVADDPPLPFFILFEAAFEPGSEGRRLGALGSVLLAEAIFGALASDPLPVDEEGGLADALGALVADLRGSDDGRLDGLSGVDTMAGLVEATADLAGLRHACPPFI